MDVWFVCVVLFEAFCVQAVCWTPVGLFQAEFEYVYRRVHQESRRENDFPGLVLDRSCRVDRKHPLFSVTVNLWRVCRDSGWRLDALVSSPAVVGGLEGGVTQTCSLLCLGCRSGRLKVTTGTASSVTCPATSSRVTTASGFITSSVCRRSSSPETEGPTGSVWSAG